MGNLNEILENSYAIVLGQLSETFIQTDEIRVKLEAICRSTGSKAPIRFLLACLLAKIDNPKLDIRKPYTEIKGKDHYSGRNYDESYIEPFIYKYKLPCNATTAFLTPAFRTNTKLLTPDLDIGGKPKHLHTYALEILDAVHKKIESPENVLKEILKFLTLIKKENEQQMAALLLALKPSEDFIPLSAEEILNLLTQHLSSKNASRLPVLIITAVYLTLKNKIGEQPLPLQMHTAADIQTGSIGDVEITLTGKDNIVTCYEMKDKRVTKIDIDHAFEKISKLKYKIDNYIFITTEEIEHEVSEHAKGFYEATGIECVILDCLGFTKHFLHFFHRDRVIFLDNYQTLLISEPTSSVSEPLKQAFLALRKAAEA